MTTIEYRKIDYHSSIFLGVLFLFVGIVELIVGTNYPYISWITLSGAFLMFLQAFFRYRRKKQWSEGT